MQNYNETRGIVREPQRFSVNEDYENTPNVRMTTRLRKMTSKRVRWLLSGILAVFVLLVFIVIITTVTLSHRNVCTNCPGPLLCDINETVELETTTDFHQPCSTYVNVVESCRQANQPAWRLFEPNQDDWHTAMKLIPDKKSNITSIVVSPIFQVVPGACQHFHFSFNLKSNSLIRSYVLTQSNFTERLILTSQMCNSYFVGNDSQSTAPTSLRLVIVSDSRIERENAAVSVTSQKSCPSFTDFSSFAAITTRQPLFPRVPSGQTNLCSLEINGGTKVNCDWMNLGDVDNADFDRVQSHSCVSSGVNSNQGQSWFLALQAKTRRSRALLISPVMRGRYPYVLFSFWFMMKCREPLLRVYLVPHTDDAATAWTSQHLVKDIRQTPRKFDWQFESLRIPVPSSYDQFQILIEGIVPSNGTCADHKCYVSSIIMSAGTPKTPLLAIDDLSLEGLNAACDLTEKKKLANIDCKFETNSGSPTTCNWTSARLHQHDSFKAWKTVQSTAKNTTGHVLNFDPIFLSNNVLHFRSPLVTANSNCSCNMTFRYLLGIGSPSLEVHLVLGADVNDNSRPMVQQWAYHGYATSLWHTSTVMLNLNTRHPFQVDLRIAKSDNARISAKVDDLFFQNCDFSYH